MPLTNTEANQVRVNIEYSVEDESLENEMINAVMAVFAPNEYLLKTTSFPSGFTAQSEGVETLRTAFRDKSLTSVSGECYTHRFVKDKVNIKCSYCQS